LKVASFDASALKAAGFDANALKKAGFNISLLKAAGFDVSLLALVEQLKEAGTLTGWLTAQKREAAGTLERLADNALNRYAIREAGGIPPLVELVKSGSDAEKVKAAGALRNLADNNANRDAIREEGGIPPLVALVRSGSPAQKKKAAGALERLADNEQNRIEIPVSCAGADIMHGNNTSYWRQHEAPRASSAKWRIASSSAGSRSSSRRRSPAAPTK